MSEMWHLRLDRLVSQFPGERDPALPAEPRESCFRRQLDSPDLAGKAPALSDRAPQQGDHAEHERLEVRRADPEARLQLVRDRKSVVWGRSGSVRVNLGGRRIIKKK